MMWSGVLAIAVVVMAMSFQETSALYCWDCSTGTGNKSQTIFCSDLFDGKCKNFQDRKVPCPQPPQHESNHLIPVCKKHIEAVNVLGNITTVLSRSCYWQEMNATKDACSIIPPASRNRTTEFCETCTTDGCNGALPYGPAALLITTSTIIAKILSL